MRSPQLVAAFLCADVLTNPGGRLSAYNILLDVSADRYPTMLPYLVAVGVWMHEAPEVRLCTTRVVVLSPDRTVSLAEAADRFSLGGEVVRHVSVHRFRNVLLPEAGVYRVQFLLGTEIVQDIPLVAVELETGRQGDKETG